jgi:hypothetical protein
MARMGFAIGSIVRGYHGPLGTFVVSQHDLQTHVQALASSPRASGTPALAAARDYCAQRLTELGYSVERQSFDLFGVSGQNVIGTRAGTSLPSRRVLLSAHIQAPRMNSNAGLITGVVCGVRVEEVSDPLMQKIRYLDKLVDELAKGKKMASVLRQ